MEAPKLRYFDYAATAPLGQEAAEAMQPYMVWGVDGLAANGCQRHVRLA